jgi:alpha-N-arabinofuranosidase
VAKTTSLHAASFEATNSITEPEMIHPVNGTARFAGTKLERTLMPYTIEVVEVPLR